MKSEYPYREKALAYYYAHREEKTAYTMEYLKYRPWLTKLNSARQRCNNPGQDSWKIYGKRGIRCLLTAKEIKMIWLRDRADKLARPSLDRIDPDGDYTAENCRFIELSDNIKRKRYVLLKACYRGHNYDAINTYVDKKGRRQCKSCLRINKRARRSKGLPW